jgi:NAD(P)-dependent dehydrogenase (short-subunit alcohol dehydrogenase family)
MAQTDMQGKICLVTGSTSGLGKATAFALAQQHATVILGCRDKQRGEAVLAEIKAGSLAATVDLLLLDLSVQQSVRTAVTEFENRYNHLDVLINNAAVFKRHRTLTADGYETMFATAAHHGVSRWRRSATGWGLTICMASSLPRERDCFLTS